MSQPKGQGQAPDRPGPKPRPRTFAEVKAENVRRHGAVARRNEQARERRRREQEERRRRERERQEALGQAPRSAPPAPRSRPVTPPVVDTGPALDRLAAVGRALWAELHRYALAWDGDRAAAEAFLAGFRRRVPAAGCACRAGWDQALVDDPPDLESPARLFEWTVRTHNRINKKLGKPEVAEEEARRIWGPPPADPR